MVLNATYCWSRRVSEARTRHNALPEAKFGGSLPKFIELLFVARKDERVVDDEERMGGHIVRERNGGGKARHRKYRGLHLRVNVEHSP